MIRVKLERVRMNKDGVFLLDMIFSLFAIGIIVLLISLGFLGLKSLLGY